MRSLASIPRGYLWIGIIAALALLVGWWVWANFFETYHLAQVDPVLYRDGFRTFREFQTAVGKTHVTQVVCLLDDDELKKAPFNLEDDYCRRSRIAFTHIPIKLGGWPTSEDVQKFLVAAKIPKYQPLMIHCAQGVRRTGMMVAAYQMSVLGWDKEKTKAAMLTFGHSERTVGDVTRFIDEYDPKTMTVPEGLPMGKE